MLSTRVKWSPVELNQLHSKRNCCLKWFKQDMAAGRGSKALPFVQMSARWQQTASRDRSKLTHLLLHLACLSTNFSNSLKDIWISKAFRSWHNEKFVGATLTILLTATKGLSFALKNITDKTNLFLQAEWDWKLSEFTQSLPIKDIKPKAFFQFKQFD